MGRCQVKQPLFEVGIRPAVMVRSSPSSAASLPLAEDAPQSHANPDIEFGEGTAVTVFEVFKPAPQRAVDVGYDHVQATARGPSRFRPDRVPELRQALAVRRSPASSVAGRRESRP